MKFIAFFLYASALLLRAEPVPLFDGKSLDGWEVPEAHQKWWRVEEGMIVGGSLAEKIPANTFLSTSKRYENFELRFKIRLVKGEGFMNSGIQVRSERDGVPMSGYQVDAGIGYWGDLYDEHRRNKKVAGAVDPGKLKEVTKDWEWNDYRILCEGRRIRSWINGEPALDFIEEDPAIPQEGLIGVQAHAGGKMLVQLKDITIDELPATPKGADLHSPESQRAAFQVPEGYEIELVASEAQGVGKPVTVTWDHSGRMWTMTALEYPVDANENEAAAEALFRRGGKDKVWVFDEPWKPGPQQPRVFADGLAIPLGLLPWKGGALVQYGHEVRYYEDRNKDGRMDDHPALLAGFGIQDSHLFAHQFERAPGGWFYIAQGLFNYSKVVRPDGSPFAGGEKEIPFSQCKLARAKLDGSDFELLTAGPNNIWGLATARDGSTFLQEANDMGHPVSEFVAGTHYPTSSREKLKAYAPQLPESTPGVRLGGTGLSGIAIAEDEGSRFAEKWPDEKVFYIANPITNRIQIVTQRMNEAGHPVYTKREDFLTCSDPCFRPVAAHFGPDGCLYLVDWYNKIISHNEVPRTHPDRDKTRGRIWRVKPAGVAIEQFPDLTRMKAAEIVGLLGGKNARVSRMAWEELGDRRDVSVLPQLRRLAKDGSAAVPKRLGALWALREMRSVDEELLAGLARDPSAAIRRETLNAAGEFPISSSRFAALVARDESDFQVLCAAANALRRLKTVTPDMAAAVASHVTAHAEGKDRAAYERNFLRYLVRWALEEHPATTDALAESGASEEARLLAILALPPDRGVAMLLKVLPALGRPLVPDELALLGGRLGKPEVAAVFARLLDDPAGRKGMLAALLQLDPSSATDPVLRKAVGTATRSMLAGDPASLPLAMDLARHFQLRELAPVFVAEARRSRPAGEIATLLGTLNSIQSPDASLAAIFLDHADPSVAREAVSGFAAAGGEKAVKVLAERWPAMPGVLRQFALDGMLSRREPATAFARAAAEGQFPGFDPSAVEKLSSMLGPENPTFKAMLEKVSGLLAKVVRLPGKDDAFVSAGITLEGAFTVETWIRMDGKLDNRDSLLGSRTERVDFNFHDRRLHLYAGRDIAVADRQVAPGEWVHCAVTRDVSGNVSLYLDGELAGKSEQPLTRALRGLDPGRAIAVGGTEGRFLEFRIWNRALTVAEVSAGYRTRPTGPVEGMVFRLPGEGTVLELRGGTGIEWTPDFPELVTPEIAKEMALKFERFRSMTSKQGDAAAGKGLFQATCSVCHQVRGEGMAIGPDLTGAGAMGVESLIRNVLSPNAQLESGYYRHDLTLAGGGVVSGFLASEDDANFVIRQIGSGERAIRKSEVKEHTVSKRSLMPEGLIDGFTEKQVADIFAYLSTLK